MQAGIAHKDAELAALRSRRERQARNRRIRRAAAVAVVLVVGGAFIAAVVYAGSPGTLSGGETIAGVDVGGMSSADAQRALERREAALASVPLLVHVGGRTFRVREGEIGVDVDWAKAVVSARDKGDGFGPIRGLRRILMATFGADVTPPVTADGRGLAVTLGQISSQVGVPHRDAAVRLNGLHPVVVAGQTGRSIDRQAARTAILGSFAALSRKPITVPLAADPPRVTAQMLAPVVAKVQTALAAPVRLRIGPTAYRVPRWQIAAMLRLPAHGSRTISIGGKKADRWFALLQKDLNRRPRDATFTVAGSRVRIVPDREGRAVDVPATARNLLAAALAPWNRTTEVVVQTKQANRTAKDARAMGVKEVVSSYTTVFGGVANRIHNVQVVAHLIDDTLIAPGKTFSFNGTTGERNASKGFLEAPVIINGELGTGLGGGVCQVSTTVFNAAYEAGLDITARTNHALYISHYPQGRDATVDYPGIDLRFVNDTDHWLLLRTFVSYSSLTVNLYGTDPHRKVESETGPLDVIGPPPLEKTKDPTLYKGKKVVESEGSSALATSVHRKVYSPSGKLLYDNVWNSRYAGEKRIVRVGTKPKPKPAVGPTGAFGAIGPVGGVGVTGPTGATGVAP